MESGNWWIKALAISKANGVLVIGRKSAIFESRPSTMKIMVFPFDAKMQNPACNLKFTEVFEEQEYFQDGDFIIGAVLTVKGEEKISPKQWEYRKAVRSVLQILSGPGKTIPNYSCAGKGKLAGVIGDHYSSTTIPIAQILGLYRYTQISYGATDYALSERKLYPHVFRTVQNDYVYYFAMAKLVKHFGWTWVGILLSDDDAGENELYKYVKRLGNPLTKQKTFFDKNGEFVFPYQIVNFVNTGKHKIAEIMVGNFTLWATDDENFNIDSTRITWNRPSNKKPESRCSDICLLGTRKKPGNSIHPCCYACIPCSEGEISNETDSRNCIKCSWYEWPNEKKDRCIPKLLEFLSYRDYISLAFISISVTLCIVTLLVMGVFIYYLNTPIVKANNRNLSFVLLVCIMLSFLCMFLFLGQPVDITCILRVVTFGIIFSIAVSSLLAKTIMVYIAFKSTKPGNYWKKWTGVRLANFIAIACSSVQGIICIFWLSVSHPYKEMNTHSYQDKIVIQCNEGSVIGFYSVLGYMGFLAAVSFVLAFMVRTLPDSFNEAKYITFSMLVFCSVWIAMIPAYLSTRGKYMVAVEVFAILASGAGLLSCICLPKCFIILFRPESNMKEYVLNKKNKY
ncbi:vomeronasal type-2 receptor 26-like [Mantella aurantiaca]